MIKLNVRNGSLEFYGMLINHSSTVQEFILQNAPLNIELWVDNAEYKTYRLNYSDNYILMIRVFNNITYSLEIYSRKKGVFVDSLSKVLAKIGGEGDYSWGSVKMNVDDKAGYRSVLINYD